MKILDKYILKRFLGGQMFTTLIVLVISVVIDISEKIDSFINPNLPLNTIVWDYYINFIVFYSNLLSPIIVFITIILMTSKLTNNTEIIAILSSGVRFNRLLRPYLIGATIITGSMLIMSHLITPKSTKKIRLFEDEYVDHKKSGVQVDKLYRQIRLGQFIFLKSYNEIDKSGHQFSYDIFENGKLKSSIKADYIEWVDSVYRLTNYKQRIALDRNDIIKFGSQIDTIFPFKYDELVYADYVAETMSTYELDKFLEKEELKGSENISAYLVEFYKRTSIPFATYILVVIGVSLCSRKKRGGMGINMAVGMAIVFLYIFMMRTSNTFAIKSGFHPLVAVWLPNIVFGVIAYFLYRNAKK